MYMKKQDLGFWGSRKWGDIEGSNVIFEQVALAFNYITTITAGV